MKLFIKNQYKNPSGGAFLLQIRILFPTFFLIHLLS